MKVQGSGRFGLWVLARVLARGFSSVKSFNSRRNESTGGLAERLRLSGSIKGWSSTQAWTSIAEVWGNPVVVSGISKCHFGSNFSDSDPMRAVVGIK